MEASRAAGTAPCLRSMPIVMLSMLLPLRPANFVVSSRCTTYPCAPLTVVTFNQCRAINKVEAAVPELELCADSLRVAVCGDSPSANRLRLLVTRLSERSLSSLLPGFGPRLVTSKRHHYFARDNFELATQILSTPCAPFLFNHSFFFFFSIFFLPFRFRFHSRNSPFPPAWTSHDIMSPKGPFPTASLPLTMSRRLHCDDTHLHTLRRGRPGNLANWFQSIFRVVTH